MVIHLKRHSKRIYLAVALIFLYGMMSPAFAQKTKQELPVVVAGQMPLYPIIARAARIQGVVKIKVTTDGKRVTAVYAESGPPMLVKFAKQNILTWEFLQDKPATFITTIEYVIEEPAKCVYSNDSLTLNLPLEIRVSAKGVTTCDPGATDLFKKKS